MKLGTLAYEEKIYNLDYMNSKEIEELLKKIVNDKKNTIEEGKKILGK